MTKIERIVDFFQFNSYSLIKDEINFSYDIKAGLAYYKCLIRYTNDINIFIIRDFCFDNATREIIKKDPLKQLNNFRNFLIKKFNLTIEDRIGWSIGFSDERHGIIGLIPL